MESIKKEQVNKIGTYKVRKSGNSVSVTLPVELGFLTGEMIEIGQVDKDTLILKREKQESNPWKSGKYDNVDFRKEIENIGFNLDEERRFGREL